MVLCPTGQFCCSNDVCLENYQVCDGVNDCQDGSDERGCESSICKEANHFRCSRYVCIHENQVCDGKTDCENGADEKRCESDICKEVIHFRCSASVCIHPDQVCDGKKDCEDGYDERSCEVETEAVKEENSSLTQFTSRLLSHREHPYSWGKNAARAITALYLSGNASFLGNDMEEELMAKELELQISVALLRNVTEQMSVNELSIFINALTVTCYNPRRFFGNDLLQTLSDRMPLTSSLPGPFLTLCNSGWTINKDATESLVRSLRAESRYPFSTDLQAIAVMALACIKNRTQHLEPADSSAKLYNSILLKFMGYQNSDGSFGNPQTTAWITQALFASGQQRNGKWNPNAALNYLKRYLKSSDDFLLTYLTLPILKGKSLLNIGDVNCTGGYRHQADDIDGLIQKLKGNLRIKYSLYVGDNQNEMHTMDLRMPNGSSVYDVMRAVQLTDQKYRFLSKTVSDYRYVYEMTGVPNDPEMGLFWLLYKRSGKEVEVVHANEKSECPLIRFEENMNQMNAPCTSYLNWNEEAEVLRIKKLLHEKFLAIEKENLKYVKNIKLSEDDNQSTTLLNSKTTAPNMSKAKMVNQPSKSISSDKCAQPYKDNMKPCPHMSECCHHFTPEVQSQNQRIQFLNDIHSSLVVQNKGNLAAGFKNKFTHCAIPLSPPVRLKEDIPLEHEMKTNVYKHSHKTVGAFTGSKNLTIQNLPSISIPGSRMSIQCRDKADKACEVNIHQAPLLITPNSNKECRNTSVNARNSTKRNHSHLSSILGHTCSEGRTLPSEYSLTNGRNVFYENKIRKEDLFSLLQQSSNFKDVPNSHQEPFEITTMFSNVDARNNSTAVDFDTQRNSNPRASFAENSCSEKQISLPSESSLSVGRNIDYGNKAREEDRLNLLAQSSNSNDKTTSNQSQLSFAVEKAVDYRNKAREEDTCNLLHQSSNSNDKTTSNQSQLNFAVEKAVDYENKAREEDRCSLLHQSSNSNEKTSNKSQLSFAVEKACVTKSFSDIGRFPIEEKKTSASSQTECNLLHSILSKEELTNLIKNIVFENLAQVLSEQIFNPTNTAPVIQKVDSGIPSEFESDATDTEKHQMLHLPLSNRKTPTAVLMTSKGIQVSFECQNLISHAEICTQTDKSSPLLCNSVLKNSETQVQKELSANRNELTSMSSFHNPLQMEKMIQNIYENVCTKKESNQSSYQDIPSPLVTRDVAVQFNPLHTSTKSTSTYVNTRETSSQCDDAVNAKGKIQINATSQTEYVLDRIPSVSKVDISMQCDQQMFLDSYTQTSDFFLQSEHSVSTSVSSTPVSESMFMDDMLSEGEIPLPWNLRLLSMADKIMDGKGDTTESSDISLRDKDYSLSEGEIPPNYVQNFNSRQIYSRDGACSSRICSEGSSKMPDYFSSDNFHHRLNTSFKSNSSVSEGEIISNPTSPGEIFSSRRTPSIVYSKYEDPQMVNDALTAQESFGSEKC